MKILFHTGEAFEGDGFDAILSQLANRNHGDNVMEDIKRRLAETGVDVSAVDVTSAESFFTSLMRVGLVRFIVY